MKVKDKKACIFYFLMTLIFLDFANQLKILSYNPYFKTLQNPFVSIVHLNNTGSAFSMFQNDAKVLAVFGILVVAYLTFYVIKKITFEDKMALLSLTLFTAGTLGNTIERIRFNYVIDYIKLNFIDFPVFNAFDIMICTGIALYIIFVLFKKEFEKKKKINDDDVKNIEC